MAEVSLAPAVGIIIFMAERRATTYCTRKKENNENGTPTHPVQRSFPDVCCPQGPEGRLSSLHSFFWGAKRPNKFGEERNHFNEFRNFFDYQNFFHQATSGRGSLFINLPMSISKLNTS